MVWMLGDASCDADIARQESAGSCWGELGGMGFAGEICKTQNPVPRDRITLRCQMWHIKEESVFVLDYV